MRPENKKNPSVIATFTCTSPQTDSSVRISPQASANPGSSALSRDPSKPPRKRQSPSKTPPATANNSRKRQTGSRDDPPDNKHKIERPPKNYSLDNHPSTNRYHALQSDIECDSVSDSRGLRSFTGGAIDCNRFYPTIELQVLTDRVELPTVML